MKRMHKMMLCLVALVCIAAVIAGCTTHSSMSYTFNVETGDAVKVTLDTSDKYKISTDGRFTISLDGKTLTQGIFIHGDAYAQYVTAAKTDDKATVLDSGTKDGHEYIFWSYNGKEYNHAILITGSNTGIILCNQVSEESAKACFDRLSFSLEK